jgi:predicted kinase
MKDPEAPVLIALMGIPGSGKSTLAREFMDAEDYTLVNPDTIRQELTGDMTDQSRNEDVFLIAHQMARLALGQGKDVLWDATNVTQRARTDLLADAIATNASSILVVVDVLLPTAKERNAARDRVVPEHVLDRMFGQYMQSLSQIGFEGWDEIHFHRS